MEIQFSPIDRVTQPFTNFQKYVRVQEYIVRQHPNNKFAP